MSCGRLTNHLRVRVFAGRLKPPHNHYAKVLVLLSAVEQFALFDSIRAFETLGTAIAAFNRLKVDAEPARASATTKPPLLRIKSFTVVNGKEMTSENDATIDSIDFHEIGSLAAQDYIQARLLANKIEQPVLRANYLTALATSVLKPRI